MKVVSLVSGGKDSCYNMVLCRRHGHEVVALANLSPPAGVADDLDSYMYQTVGHQLVAAYARCMHLPLYRRAITGTSADQRLVYEDTAGDEVEDLHSLLAWVKAAHPDVAAVACGAIASDYQRTRVERVCARLGLVSLAYLWHQPQAALLRRMIDARVEAVLVKVAAAGLSPARHLGARLADLPAQLRALRRAYGSNVCGEGGEYESLTLDCPQLFTHGRLVLDAWDAVVVSPDSLAPVALLHPTAFHVEPRRPAGGAAAGDDGTAQVVEVPADWAPPPAPRPPASGAAAAAAALDVRLGVTAGDQHCSLTAAVPSSAMADPTSPAGTAAALAAALRRVSDALPGLDLAWPAALFVHLYVPAMAQFGAANEAYAAVLPPVNPPSRATVELAGGAGLALVVEMLFARRAQGRRVLHVQSISEWAPSCIGPYSQATRHHGLVHFAGQIALDPPTMDVVGGGIDAQCVRCLLSCQKVAVAVRTDLPRSMLWCTLYSCDAAGLAGRQRAAAHLAAFLDGRLDTSVLERQQTPHSAGERDAGSDGGDSGSDDDDQLDDYLRPPPMHRHWAPQATFVTVPQLPRGVLVEVQPVACVVDESLALDSSSSSDEDAEAAEQRQSRRAAAAAARPSGSTMPGWIGRVQHSGSASTSRLWSPGRLCRVQAWVGRDQQGDVLQAVQAAAQELVAALAVAGLEAADVAACKVYCLAGLLDSQQVQPQTISEAGLCGTVAATLPGVRPTVVPVTAVGASPAADCAVLLELLASRG